MDWSDAAARSSSRLLLMYNLETTQPLSITTKRPLTDVLAFGRLEDHINAAGPLLPAVVFDTRTKALRLGPERLLPDLFEATIILAVTPRGDALLLLDVCVDTKHPSVLATILFHSWRHRSKILVEGEMLGSWLDSHIGVEGGLGPPGLMFGRNVHQSVFPGGDLARSIMSGAPDHGTSESMVDIVLRGTLDGSRGSDLGVRRPEILNNPQQTLVAHGRGVSLAVGWTDAIENSFALAALGILNAIACIHRVRKRAFEALTLNENADLRSNAQARELISNLSRRLTDLQLDLAFSVEAYADAILIPELLIESFHSSLRNASDMTEGIANTSRIVDRVSSAIDARRLMLEAAGQEYIEKRDKILGIVVAVGTLLALPPTLLFGFFGTNGSDVDSSSSILDVTRYPLVYVIAWFPFVVVIIFGFVMRRRVRVHVPDIYGPHE